MAKRKFTKELLEELLEQDAGGSAQGLTVVAFEDRGRSRWATLHRVIFRDQDNRLWAAKYQQPATEQQDCDTFDTYGDEVECVEVMAVEYTAVRYAAVP